ncbi:coagulation factor IX-like [Mytilus edulis]|uniref:coagulation factor IX-like n=1 Tax=Mytilus edulis TaxID=6550 RepID=UPI0039EE5865
MTDWFNLHLLANRFKPSELSESDLSITSDSSFSDRPGNNLWLYLCMKLAKITTDLYYFYLLSDINSSTEPNERAFMSADNAPMSSTVCQYTGSPKIRTLRKQGSNDVLPNDASLCEPWNSACDVDDRCDPNPCQNNGTCVDLTDSFNCTCDPGWEDVNCTTATTIMTPTATTQKQSIPSMSTAIGTATSVKWIETTQNAMKPSTSIEIDSTTDGITTGTTQKTSVPSVSRENGTIYSAIGDNVNIF